jgi:hypothetical protein
MADVFDVKMPQVSLASLEHKRLVEVIESLKLHGIDSNVTPPRIVVLGDRSSGKSSVLEALSGVAFPIRGNLCTRYPIELALQKSAEVNVDISIKPHGDRSEAEKMQLESFSPPPTAVNDMSLLIRSADKAMGLKYNGKTVHNDKLMITVSGPTQPTLTLVDLPGLHKTGAPCSGHPADVTVSKVIGPYLKDAGTIILAVSSSQMDYESQIHPKFLELCDTARKRVIGIITKPDVLQVGSRREKAVLELVAGRKHHFGFGWHVLKNRDYGHSASSAEERDTAEAAFFSRGAWSLLPADQVGIGSLKARVTQILKDKISTYIPTMIRATERALATSQKELQVLGDPRSTRLEQQLYLCRIAQQFSSLLKAAADGIYDDTAFFGSPMSSGGYERRLGSRTQSILIQLAKDLHEKGHAEEIVDVVTDKHGPSQPRRVLRADALRSVRELMDRSRGAELPGTVSSQLVGELFLRQAVPWTAILESSAEQILQAIHTTVRSIIRHVADQQTAEELLEHAIHPALESLKEELKAKISVNLEHPKGGYLVSYHKEFTENMQKARQASRKRALSQRLHDYFGVTPGTYQANNHVKRTVSITGLLEDLCTEGEGDAANSTCVDALDCMQAYYEVC